MVDDDEFLPDMVSKVLRRSGYEVDVAANVAEALELLKQQEYAVVVTDKNMDGREGSEEGGMLLLQHIKKHYPSTEVLMMTGFATVETAIEAMRMGAFDYMIKPFSPEELRLKIDRVLACKSFLNPERALRVHKVFHDNVIKLLEQREEQDDGKLLASLSALEESITGFLTMQKEWERIILLQREALSQISAHAEQLRERLEAGEPSLDLVDKILDHTLERL